MGSSELRNRFTVLGHLKINIESIKDCGYSQKQLNDMLDNLQILASKMIDKSIRTGEDMYARVFLGPNRRAWITVTGCRVNAWIIDDVDNVVTQKMHIDDAFLIMMGEPQILNLMVSVSFVPQYEQEKKDYLLGKLLQAKYGENSPTRGSPNTKSTCMGYGVDDDFEIG